jgi:ribose/xylose/arabinose/galactoside ABC-type transport system permease subunit
VAVQEISTSARRRSAGAKVGIAGFLPIAVIVVLVVIFAILTDAFLTFRNLTAVASQASILLLASTGATFVVLMGSIDLSVGAIVLLVGAVVVTAINALDLGFSAIALGILLGGLLGLTNGAVFARGLIPSFVVTLGSLSVSAGLRWNFFKAARCSIIRRPLMNSRSASLYRTSRTWHSSQSSCGPLWRRCVSKRGSDDTCT